MSVIKNLKTVADTKIVNGGGTNYNVGFDEAFKALTGPGVDPKRPKGAIFLTDGGHNSGPYNNGHLRFAINATGNSWPVCVVQLGDELPGRGRRAPEADRRRDRRPVRVDAHRRPVGRPVLQLPRPHDRRTDPAEQDLQVQAGPDAQGPERLPKKKLPSVTFFVNWGNGTYQLQLKDPKGHIHTRKRPGRGATFGQGNSYAFFRIRRPDGGVWQVIVKALTLEAATDQANVKITVIPRKK